MYGFPDELYRISYPAKGSTELSLLTKGLISKKVETDNSWGYDHGTWSVLCRMYPEADIPVYQLSVDMDADAETQYETGRELRSLREQGVLILGSGNVVHNLSKIGWGMTGGYSWAEEFDEYIKGKIATGKFQDVIHYETAGKCAEIAFHTPEHFYPLLHVLGASCEDDRLTVFNDSCVMGSLSMTCYLFE
jgi:4,5-DOPA dioxygenase extradiol